MTQKLNRKQNVNLNYLKLKFPMPIVHIPLSEMRKKKSESS